MDARFRDVQDRIDLVREGSAQYLGTTVLMTRGDIAMTRLMARNSPEHWERYPSLIRWISRLQEENQEDWLDIIQDFCLLMKIK